MQGSYRTSPVIASSPEDLCSEGAIQRVVQLEIQQQQARCVPHLHSERPLWQGPPVSNLFHWGDWGDSGGELAKAAPCPQNLFSLGVIVSADPWFSLGLDLGILSLTTLDTCLATLLTCNMWVYLVDD